MPYAQDEKNPETAASRLLTSIIDNDPEAQAILFHDSRQGAERIASMARRPHQIVAYRAGYLPEERRQIEDKIRSRDLRGVVTTSALEVGIDMPDLNFGLPPTRKQMRQRLGRVGRSSPATFVILGDSDLFRRHSENLQAYYNGTIEETRLYLDNPYIAYQHALCLQRGAPEISGIGANQDPDSPEWPDVFHDTMALAQSGQPPVSLAHAHARSIKMPPQLAYSLRSSGEEQIDIVPSIDGEDRENIGTINAPAAIREAYPGAIYRHNGRTCRVTEADPDATELVFYPAKAIANDQLIRWKGAAEAANMYPESIQQITGDTPMRLREQLLNGATVALLPPAWPLHGPSEQPGPPPKCAFSPTAESRSQTGPTSTRTCPEPTQPACSGACKRPRSRTATAISSNTTPRRQPSNPQKNTCRASTDACPEGRPRAQWGLTYPTLLLHVPYPQDEKNPELAASRLPPSITGNELRDRAFSLPGPWAECRAQRRHGPPGRFSA